jgi:hypothetical protein
MNCYFDGSRGGQSDKWLTLGGFIATDAVWAKFQKDWEQMLKSRYPVAPYIHMTDIVHGVDPFERKAGWTVSKVQELVRDAILVLGELDQSKICGFACSVDTSARDRIYAEGFDIPDASQICAEIGLGSLLNWYTDQHDIGLAHLFYDQGEPFIGSIRSRWTEAERSPVKHPFWGRLANIQPVSMKTTSPIQAADILAWAFTRRLRDAEDDEWANLATLLLGSRGRRGMLTNTQLDPIDEAILRKKHPTRR